MQDENTIRYFTELQRPLTKEGIQTLPPAEDRLPIMLDSQEVGVVIPTGGMRYRQGALDTDEAHDLFYRTAEIASEVREYMNLMEAAPPLKAQGLDEPYKLLAEFNGYVLGGVEGKYGIQFTTWMQDYDRNGVTVGHYFEGDYAGAKQDFSIRCHRYIRAASRGFCERIRGTATVY